jgi:acyl transferase domain-containing protein
MQGLSALEPNRPLLFPTCERTGYMPRKTVLLFPGQGAYLPGALRSLTRELPEMARTFAEVDAVASAAGLSPVSEAVAGPDAPELERLLLDQPPHILQLTLYATSVGMYRTLIDQGVRAHALAGHSLGEIAALVCGGAFTVAEGAQIVLHRTEVVGETNPGGVMAALGANPARAQQILDLVGDATTVIAAENGPRQTVVSGPDSEVESVESIARALKISSARLRSPFPFHNPLLAEASERLARRLTPLPQRSLTTPVYSPILGRYYTDDDRLTDALAVHLTTRVSFATALAGLGAAGADVFVETGVGATLSRLVRDSVTDVAAVACVDGVGDHFEAFQRARATLTQLGVVTTSATADVVELLLPDVDEARRRSFWAARGDEVVAQVRAALRDHEAAKEATRADAAASIPEAPTSTAPEVAESDPPAPPVAVPSRDQLLAELSDMYATALEYPVEVFTEDVELEADLGVDSVKQTELLSRAAERYHLPERPENFRLSDWSTMGRVTDFVFGALVATPAA